MSTNKTESSSDSFDDGLEQVAISPFSKILLSSDNLRGAEALLQCLIDAGFDIQMAADYSALESSWKQHRYLMVLLDVTHIRSVEAAVDTAMRIKRHDPLQFVGYLADPILWTSGLTGDAIFPRSFRLLPDALRSHLESQDGGQRLQSQPPENQHSDSQGHSARNGRR